jgi:hypothetical protein
LLVIDNAVCGYRRQGRLSHTASLLIILSESYEIIKINATQVDETVCLAQILVLDEFV